MLAKAYGLSWNGAKKVVVGASWKGRRAGPEMRKKDGDLGLDEALAASCCHRVRFHDLRHTYASHFMMSGGNILALQKLLGHYDVSVTMKYAHLAPDHLATEAARVSFEASANVKAKVVALAEHVAQPQSGVGP